MKDELKNILLMGLGAMSLTTDKAKELRKDLLREGEKAYNEGKILNEELKHNTLEKIRDTIGTSKESIVKAINNMSDDEKKEIMDLLNESK